MKKIRILAIESSCDESSAAILEDAKVLCNIVASQQVHQKYGGVVPELASRAHQQNIVPVVEMAFRQTGLSVKDLSAVAFTRGPGLLGALLVGTSFAKGLALAQNLPLIEVNHIQAHVLAHFIDEPKPKFPFLCLTVSGGHTQIVLVKDFLEMEVVGQTQDDAAGEAFDKTAKLLGLGYPGGALIDKYAKNGNPNAFPFPTPNIDNFDFSFSGIKTAILYFLQKNLKENPNFIQENLVDICASVQQKLVDILLKKLAKAAQFYQIRHIAIAGGVSANSGLRTSLTEMAKKKNWQIYIPDFQYCTDNAGMIAMAAYYKYLQQDFCGQDVSPLARMDF